MKTSKQDIQDLLSQLAADIEEIKVMLDGGAAGVGASSKTAAGNSAVTANSNHIVTEVKRLSESVAGMCNRLTDKMKSYHVQLWKYIISDIREELNSGNDTRKRKGLLTIENKIDNSLMMLVSIYDRLTQLEDAMLPDTPRQEQIGERQPVYRKSANGKSSKSGIKPALKSAWSVVRKFCTKQPTRWYRNPYILCVVVIYFLYFGLSIFSWQQWHHYRNENVRLRLAVGKYRVDSIIIREIYPQAAIALSVYEHITESEGADAALNAFWNKVQD